MKCPICNGPLKQNAKFCTSCGTNIEVLKESGLLDLNSKEESPPEAEDFGMPQAPPPREKEPEPGDLGGPSEPQEPQPPPSVPEPEEPEEEGGKRKKKKRKEKKEKAKKAKARTIKPTRPSEGAGKFVKLFLLLIVLGGGVIVGLHFLKNRGKSEREQGLAELKKQEEMESFYEALQLIQKGSLKDGVAALEQLRDTYMEDEIPFFLAFVHARQGDASLGLEEFAKALDENPWFAFESWSASEHTEEFETGTIENIVRALARTVAMAGLGREADPADMTLLKQSGLGELVKNFKAGIEKNEELRGLVEAAEAKFIKWFISDITEGELDLETNRGASLIKFVEPESDDKGAWIIKVGINSDDAPSPPEVKQLILASLRQVFKAFFTDKSIASKVQTIEVAVYYSPDQADPDPYDEDLIVIKAVYSARDAARVDWEKAGVSGMRWKIEVIDSEFK